MSRLKKLIEDRATAWSQVKDIRARLEADGYKPSDEDNETYERGLADVERLSQDIEREERAERAGRGLDVFTPDQRTTSPRPGDGDHEEPDADPELAYRGAFGEFLRRGIVELDAEQRQLLQRNFSQTKEMRALAAGTSTAGGYTVPKEYLNRMTEAMKDYGGILQVSDVINTADGSQMFWPTNDDTANVGAILGENVQATELDFTFGQMDLNAFIYTSKITRVSFSLLQDSAFDLDTWLPRKQGERIGRAVAGHLVNGTGSGQPQGLVTGLVAAGAIVTSSVSAKVSFDDLITLEHSIDPAYRNSGRQRYLLSDSALMNLRKVKNAQDQYVWQPSTQVGTASAINGHPYTIDNGLDALAASSRSVVFGDIASAYLVRQVAGSQQMRLTERYADFGQVGFLAFMRLDAKVQDANAARVLVTKA